MCQRFCTNCSLSMWLFDVVKIVENRILTGLSRNSVVPVRLTTVNTWQTLVTVGQIHHSHFSCPRGASRPIPRSRLSRLHLWHPEAVSRSSRATSATLAARMVDESPRFDAWTFDVCTTTGGSPISADGARYGPMTYTRRDHTTVP